MSNKIHYNPSTGKIAYDADAGKVKVFHNELLGDCCNFPDYFKLTFQDCNVLDDGCYPWGEDTWRWFVNFPDINGTYIVPFVIRDAGDQECFWYKDLEDYTGYIGGLLDDEECTGHGSTPVTLTKRPGCEDFKFGSDKYFIVYFKIGGVSVFATLENLTGPEFTCSDWIADVEDGGRIIENVWEPLGGTVLVEIA